MRKFYPHMRERPNDFSRCWKKLGVAIRIAQGIGLHTEDFVGSRSSDEPARERRRRTWYSLYVLDQLLSLQLGRPPAIVPLFFNVCLPSTNVEITSPSEAQEGSNHEDDQARIGEYFVAMIGFSHIIGEVLGGLYGPRKVQKIQEVLSLIDTCDRKLLQWRSGLPRRLRFDLGQTFDSSIIFKRLVRSRPFLED